MKKMKRLFKVNNKGVSLVTVIISIAFIAIMASVIMVTSLINYRVKRINAYAKDTFYSAEQVLDEINIGLQRYVSDSLSEAYIDVMQNYSDYDVSRKRMILQTNFYESMWEKLQMDQSHTTYNMAVLNGFLKETTAWQGADDTGYGAVLRANINGTYDSAKGTMVTYDTGIVLKGLRVYYKDSKGFVSIIETDIRLTYPEYDFATTTSLPDIPKYGIIADKGAVINRNSDLELEGNLYADNLKIEGTVIGTKSKINHSGDGKVVVKHDVSLKNVEMINTEDGTLWAEGIETMGADLNLKGQTLVADDLNVNGKNSVVTLAGTYNGFGNSITDADASSAILINGGSSTVNLSGLSFLTLGGHAFVGTRRDDSYNPDGSRVTDAAGNPIENQGGNALVNVPGGTLPENPDVGDMLDWGDRDVYTGESISAKSNQLMYLIPPECVCVDEDNISLVRKNPMTQTEYEEFLEAKKQFDANLAANPPAVGDPAANATYQVVSASAMITKIGRPLSDFIEMQGGVAQPEIVFVPTNGERMVYFYMKFDSEEKANEYFELYYNSDKTTYDNYMNTYVKELTLPSQQSGASVLLAGNGVSGRAEVENAGVVTTPSQYSMVESTVTNAATGLSDNNVQYRERFTALCTKLTENYAELTGGIMVSKDNNQVMFDNLVDLTQLETYIKNYPGNADPDKLTITTASGDKIYLCRLDTDNYEVNDPLVKLVITAGNVNITVNNFEGTILAGGTITVGANVQSIKANEVKVNELFRHTAVIDGKNVMVAEVLNDGKNYMFALEDADDEEETINTLADLIIYENWKKE